MQRSQFQVFAFLLTLGCFHVVLAGTAAAATVKFPSDNPAFTFELPSGWTHTVDKDGTLNCNLHDDSAWAFSIVPLTEVHSEKELNAELPKLARSMQSGASIKDFKMAEPDLTENAQGIKFTGLRGDGVVSGVPFTVMVNGFEAQKGRFYALVTAGATKADKEHHPDYEAIAASIQRSKSESKTKDDDADSDSSRTQKKGSRNDSADQQSGDSAAASTASGVRYADYLTATGGRSPDGKFAIIYPKASLCADDAGKGSDNRCKDYLVALQPFKVLAALDSESPEFENKNHGGMQATWSKDSSAVLVTLDQKWGPNEIFLCEIGDGKVSRSTNLLKKVREMLAVDCKKAIPERAGDCSAFVFVSEDEELPCQFAGTSQVRIRVTAKTDPKESPGRKQWDGAAEATWDIAKAEFTSQKVTRKFAGVRQDDPS